MRVVIEPTDGPADAVPAIRVTDAPANAQVTVSVSAKDAKGHDWQSSGVFRTDAAGTVDAGRDAPVSGTYEGVDAGGLLWSMRFISEDVAPSMFAASADQLPFVITATLNGEQTSATMVWRWSASGVTRSEVEGDGFRGIVYQPAGQGPHPAAAVIHGSTGAAAMEPTAALLASHGYIAMVLGYMGLSGLPDTLCEVPLEVIAAGLRRLTTLPSVDQNRVAVLGASVGTEGMLAALADVPDLPVRAVVAIAPSSVVWQALGEGRPPKKSSWTLAGQPLPYLPMHGERLLPQVIKNELLKHFSRHPRPSALHLHEAFAVSLRDQKAVAQAAIPVEKIAAPILFIAGTDDQMWPSPEMVEMLMKRRRAGGNGQNDRQLVLQDAGHIIRPACAPTTVTWTEELYSGGTPEGNARASTQAWRETLAFIETHTSV